MQLAEFDYTLPDELIARYPAPERRMSRLLLVDARSAQMADRRFGDLLEYFRAGDLLVLNDTRVVPARLHGRKASGGRVEMLIERVLSPCKALVQLRASKSPGASVKIEFAGGQVATVIGRREAFYELEFSSPVEELLESLGEVPLPPYLGRASEPSDRERYQTVYARHPGAVAAPTAGLHFDQQMLADLQNAGVGIAFVTLHVGAGTFLPLRQQSVTENRLHPERVHVSDAVCCQVNDTRAANGRIVAVGTTSVRALEAASTNGAIEPFDGETDLFIRPGYRWKSVDRLLTNFHLPRSSLLMLVAAFAGTELILRAYRHAVNERYRFFSYGDAMLVLPDETASRAT
ncbi:MAG: tRNA preQ1(34) S-adenosylmethionine ribosyltransferase-isomerase QueA [Woeseia sp.]